MFTTRVYWPNEHSPFYVLTVDGVDLLEVTAVFDYPPAYGPTAPRTPTRGMETMVRADWAQHPGDSVRFPVADDATLSALGRSGAP